MLRNADQMNAPEQRYLMALHMALGGCCSVCASPASCLPMHLSVTSTPWTCWASLCRDVSCTGFHKLSWSACRPSRTCQERRAPRYLACTPMPTSPSVPCRHAHLLRMLLQTATQPASLLLSVALAVSCHTAAAGVMHWPQMHSWPHADKCRELAHSSDCQQARDRLQLFRDTRPAVAGRKAGASREDIVDKLAEDLLVKVPSVTIACSMHCLACAVLQFPCPARPDHAHGRNCAASRSCTSECPEGAFPARLSTLCTSAMSAQHG